MNQAKIKTKFGELIIEFTDESDLNKKIEALNMEQITQMITKKFGMIKDQIQIIEEFKDLYTIDSHGIRLLKYPKDKTDQIRLALFLAGKPLTPTELKYSTGINKPTSLTARKGFEKVNDGITIDSDNRKLVLEKIIPEIRGKQQ